MKITIVGDTYVVGDIHGETDPLMFFINEYELKNCTLILLGDIGIWRYRDYKHYLKLDKFSHERNITIYAFRGNHDNPAFFYNPGERSPIATRFWEKFTNFKVIPDLTVLDVNGAKGIVIGGGVSIDRCVRRTWQKSVRYYGSLYRQNDWWEDETVPETKGINDSFDFILSHTGPRPTKVGILNATNCSFFKYDFSLKDDINKENQRIEEIQKQFNPKKWWFGHYHINDSFDFFNTRCYAIDINFISPLQM